MLINGIDKAHNIHDVSGKVRSLNEKGNYSLKMSLLNRNKYSKKEIIADLEKQGLVFAIKNREIEYLEIREATKNTNAFEIELL